MFWETALTHLSTICAGIGIFLLIIQIGIYILDHSKISIFSKKYKIYSHLILVFAIIAGISTIYILI
jgi:hypothetical protein